MPGSEFIRLRTLLAIDAGEMDLNQKAATLYELLARNPRCVAGWEIALISHATRVEAMRASASCNRRWNARACMCPKRFKCANWVSRTGPADAVALRRLTPRRRLFPFDDAEIAIRCQG